MVNRLLDLHAILRKDRSAFLFGPRGVGKTLLGVQFVSDQPTSMVIDLLNLDTYRRYLAEPALFRSECERLVRLRGVLTVMIDEVQKLPGLLDEVHHLLERHKGRIRFLLTGSSARKLKRGEANLLAGRAWTLKLHPLSALEVELDLERALLFGTLPAIYLEDDDPKRTLKAYVETYLKEEILQESLVRRAERFVRFLDVAGQVSGEPVNFTHVAKDCGVSVKTAQEYFSILVDTLVAFRVDGWTRSVRKQLRHAPKFYFFDCGVLNAVRGELGMTLEPASYRHGKLFEHLVVCEMLRLNDYFERDYRFHYWRTSAGMEVDLILSRGAYAAPTAVEIKAQSDPGESDLKGLHAFATENPKATLLCLCRTPREYAVGPVEVLPWVAGLRRIFT